MILVFAALMALAPLSIPEAEAEAPATSAGGIEIACDTVHGTVVLRVRADEGSEIPAGASLELDLADRATYLVREVLVEDAATLDATVEELVGIASRSR